MIDTVRAKRNASLLRSVSFVGLAMAAVVAAPAYAQDATGELEEVVITGSRTIRDGAQAPTPVSVLSTEQLVTASPRNIAEAIGELPAFRGSSNPNTPGPSASANNIGNRLNLRGLGEDRTLVLLDGRRVAPGDTSNRVNFDMLPQSLFRRVDVVTGGASASYGSDAVAGVVNVILDTRFEGIKGLVQAGISRYDDIGSQKFEITSGGAYLDGRLHLIASMGWRRQNGSFSQLDRPWAADFPGRISAVAGFGSALIRDFHQTNTAGGVVLATDTRNPTFPGAGGLAVTNNFQFLEGGVQAPFDPGLARNAAMIGGDGSSSYNTLAGLAENETFFIRAGYDVSDNLEVFAQAMFAETHNFYEVSIHSVVGTTGFTIYEGNVFLPQTTATALANATFTAAQARGCLQSAGYLPAQYTTDAAALANLPGNRCFRLNRQNFDMGRLSGDFINQNQDITVGFNATIFGDWRFNGYWEHGETSSRTFNINNIHFERAHAAVDAIANPAVGGLPGVAVGAPICRASIMGTPANPNPTYYRDSGCVPFNVFGNNSRSDAADAYVAPTAAYGNDARQNVWALNIAGEPFALPAGDISFAFGAEYRTLAIAQWSGADEQNPGRFTGNRAGVRGAPLTFIGTPGSYGFSNLLPYNGAVQVKEAYTEVNLPILKDWIVDEWTINAAGRYTEYSTSGPVRTWKVGTSLTFTEDARFRGTVSQDIRAPSPSELFATSSRFERVFNDPFTGTDNGGASTNQQVSSFDVTIGNPNLKPEVADSFTAGLVFTPRWTPGLTFSVDWYSISINDAISSFSTAQTLQRCYESRTAAAPQGTAAVCGNIDRVPDPTYNYSGGRIVLVRNSPQNFSNIKTRGWDIEASYKTDIAFMPGSLTTRAFVGVLTEFSTQDPGNNRAEAVSLTTNPRTRALIQFTYDNGPWSVGFQENYTSSVRISNTLIEGTEINDNQIPAYTTSSVNVRYKFGEDQQYEGFLIVNNLFDVPPPFLPGGSSTSVSYAGGAYDSIGRYYTAGLRFRF